MSVKIKICGVFRSEDAPLINAARPDFVGFVFAKSRRRVTVETAQRLRTLIDSDVKSVGVFADADEDLIAEAFGRKIIDLAQLHGGEDDAYIARLKILGIPVVKAARWQGAQAAASFDARYKSADYILLDGSSGGAGTAFDWSQIKRAGLKKPYFLAGGVNPGNIRAALNVLPRPYAVDISSGAETDGVKDGAKIAEIMRIAKGVNYE
ncbi:MAG: phosphoribosylanthranilate isomerase [Clostridiales bacterium]|jgi:phosphoribosylanthranilate isomerase|nr:phosphoribosylanthranilate isomerase [Clostridiales bacterium]